MVMPTSYLPEDLLIDILLRLPVKPLVRFRLVRAERHTMMLISGKALDVAVNIETPEIGDELVGSCNGLVCLYNRKRNITLWNPATREHKILPTLGIDPDSPNTLRWNCVGFGYHLEDYKVVRILYSRDEPPNRAQVEVYSMSTGSWRVVDAIVPCSIRPYYMCSVILKGMPYWLGLELFREKTSVEIKEFMVCFDIGNEVFWQVHVPDAEGSYRKELGVLHESLAIIYYPWREQTSNFVEIWVMKDDDCWIKVERIGPFSSIGIPLGCWKAGVVVWQNGNNELLVYDPNIKAVNKLFIYGVVSNFFSARVSTYMESLVALNETRSNVRRFTAYVVDVVAASHGEADLHLLARRFSQRHYVEAADEFPRLIQIGNALDVAVKIETPEKGMVMGSCNGLICLYNGKRNITLWNPATREHKILPTLGIDPGSLNTLRFYSVGFGYHLNDYKVVRILYSCNEPRDHRMRAQVKVYSTSTGCWRVFDAIVPCSILDHNCSVILKGVPYWMGQDYNSIRYRESVVYFDLGKEVFQQVHTPDGSYCNYGKKLGVLNESLAIICYHCSGQVSNFVDIWVMGSGLHLGDDER
ncbi:uncharacterized protein LOC132162473 [Corylus avellana]|uniref:uncharacterized protein LOC132162473 n=1 Tax=Corylus avellana TaxID=13451 RepID=UPI00286C8AE8|nr:uncharacterized protein LOC132162473 [Corylus avellana]